ncbi:MAG: DUF72 domain-containing protein [candidate division Zixibacteria bacterium]|nr:DUF72 domain-containing protein [candidate division Zixibacteria bacterium]
MDIKIGTSGYSFDDWVGSFYPTDIKKGKMLDHYVKYFPAVEINSTYYRLPHPAVMANIEKKTPPHFEFIVKTPHILTHKRTGIEESVIQLAECLKPMEQSGKLKGLLAQFPYSFKFSDSNLRYVQYCRTLLEAWPLYVEFRHNSWQNPATYNILEKEHIGFVSVDEPQLPGLLKPELICTSGMPYLRLHGRNVEHWWNGGALRYDYDYSLQELTEWKGKISGLKKPAAKLYVFFNNCHLGQAVKNARQFMENINL